MAYENFFHVAQNEDPNFFDEGPRIPKITPKTGINTSSIDTSAIDSYRQGVEITHMKYFDAGTVKIHAGEPGHAVKLNGFGMSKNHRINTPFQELDYFDPVTFLELQDLQPLMIPGASFETIITFPIITGDNDQIENFNFDGIIEVFPIREVASFFSIEVPFQSRGIRGTLIGGNADQTWCSDQVVTVDYFEPDKKQVEFLDLVDMIGISGSQQPLNGFFTFEKSTRRPFDDKRLIRNINTSSYDDEMDAALSNMTGSTDNYVAYNQRSSTTGFQYDNVAIGTDSIAFGGLTY